VALPSSEMKADIDRISVSNDGGKAFAGLVEPEVRSTWTQFKLVFTRALAVETPAD
jgi:hypothetical protein